MAKNSFFHHLAIYDKYHVMIKKKKPPMCQEVHPGCSLVSSRMNILPAIADLDHAGLGLLRADRRLLQAPGSACRQGLGRVACLELVLGDGVMADKIVFQLDVVGQEGRRAVHAHLQPRAHRLFHRDGS